MGEGHETHKQNEQSADCSTTFGNKNIARKVRGEVWEMRVWKERYRPKVR